MFTIDADEELKNGKDQVVGARFYNKSLGKTIVRINQGNCYVSGDEGELLTTTLGSCISACIRDPYLNLGGMNHFMLPESQTPEWTASKSIISPHLRYGNFAMEQLINSILRRGGKKNRLEIKLFGGGNVLRGTSNVGYRNADFIVNYMLTEGLKVAASDLRGEKARRLQYYPTSGRVQMMYVSTDRTREISREENRNRLRTRQDEASGSIELFD